jgi:YVTN family beta-propeller protein
VNSKTDEIYVVNNGNAGAVPGTVTVIDGGTNQTTTINVGPGPEAVALNEATNLIYVSNSRSNDVTVINSADNNTTTIGLSNSPADRAVAVNSGTNLIYVANGSDPAI